MKPDHTPLKNWMTLATVAEQVQLAEMLNSSRATLYQYSNQERGVSSGRAIDFEKATTKMFKITKGRLPVVLRTELSEACSRCEFAKKCLEGK